MQYFKCIYCFYTTNIFGKLKVLSLSLMHILVAEMLKLTHRERGHCTVRK